MSSNKWQLFCPRQDELINECNLAQEKYYNIDFPNVTKQMEITSQQKLRRDIYYFIQMGDVLLIFNYQ